jgi:GntR family transcriptional regulator
MFLPIDPSSGLPIYRQIMDQVRRMIAAGSLSAGDRVPSVRDLASTLQINHLTVAKAYSELEREAVLQKRRGLGMFVAEPVEAGSEPAARRLAALRGTAERLVLEAKQAGLGIAEVQRLVSEHWMGINGNDRKEGGE